MKKVGQKIINSLEKRMVEQENIIWLRVQAPVGTYFYLNNNIEPVYVNKEGLYELNIENMLYIYNINFSPYTSFSKNIIVDYIYID